MPISLVLIKQKRKKGLLEFSTLFVYLEGLLPLNAQPAHSSPHTCLCSPATCGY